MVLRMSARRSYRQGLKFAVIFWLLVGLLIMFRFSKRQVEVTAKQPQALLVLGGATERELFAAQFARQHPNLDIWVSSGSNPEYVNWVFSEAGISLTRLHLDYEAVDTVTNFTTMVGKLEAQGIESIYLITSDDHMRRARLIGEIVFGSRGIDFKPLEVPSGRSPEPVEKTLRDGARAVIWLTTGYTGACLGSRF